MQKCVAGKATFQTAKRLVITFFCRSIFYIKRRVRGKKRVYVTARGRAVVGNDGNVPDEDLQIQSPARKATAIKHKKGPAECRARWN